LGSLEEEKWKLFEDDLVYVRQCTFLVCKPCFIREEEEEEEEEEGEEEEEEEDEEEEEE